MGATGHSIFRKPNSLPGTYGIGRAVVYRGTVPEDSGIEPPSRNRVTLKVPTDDGNVLYQFRLSRDRSTMTVAGYLYGEDDAVKAKIVVDAKRPSYDQVARSGSRQETANLRKLRDMMSRTTLITEEQLWQIARALSNTKGRMM